MGAHQPLAEKICAIGRLLYDKGFIAATEGNISGRLADGRVLCTPTMISKGHMRPADLCVVDMEGQPLSGSTRPTSEMLMHLEIYRNDAGTGAVVHCHPPHATAFAISRAALPAGLLAEVEFFLGEVAVIEYRKPGSVELAELVGKHARHGRCALLRNHGAVAWDADLQRACWCMEILDAYCRAVIHARILGDYAELPESAVEELRRLGREFRLRD